MSSLQTGDAHRRSFDIFCRVIDNYGDIGVCWRLARQLVRAHEGHEVRLWVDDLGRFNTLEPGIRTHSGRQQYQGVDIVHWHCAAPALPPHDIVIEAFGCHPPADFVAAMADKDSLWLNLEYLSAETWVSGFHQQPSIQANGLRKYFFFPGFCSGAGGLLREPGLIERRNAWRSQPENRSALLRSCGVHAAAIEKVNRGARVVFLFCYRDAPVPALIHILSQQPRDTVLLVPEGIYPLARSTHDEKVCVHHIPFVRQDDFDRLLWSADLNIVRGEDSLVRAHWTGRPMIWQPYPQDNDTHLTKLDAWLTRSHLGVDTQDLIRSWTAGDSALFGDLFQRHLHADMWAQWSTQAQHWTDTLLEHTDLVTALVRFCTQHR